MARAGYNSVPLGQDPDETTALMLTDLQPPDKMKETAIEHDGVDNPAFDEKTDGSIHQDDPVADLPPTLQEQKRKILKNLAVLSIAWLFLFTGYGAIQNLQSSINKDEGLGKNVSRPSQSPNLG
jgi:hypothetical protein